MTPNNQPPTTTRPRRGGRPARTLAAVLWAGMAARHGALEIAGHYWAAVYAERRKVASPRGVEPVHRMRVANRRLRTALRQYRGVLPGDTLAAIAPTLAELNRLLAPVRDSDVQIKLLAAIRRERQTKPCATFLKDMQEYTRRQNAEARALLVTFVESGQLDAVDAAIGHALNGARRRAAQAGVSVVGGAGPTLGRAAGDAARGAVKAVKKRAKTFKADASPQALHRLRRKVRRLRYALEAVQPIGGKPLPGIAKRLVAFQDVLGDHQDQQVGLARVGEYRAFLESQGGVDAEQAAGLDRLAAPLRSSSRKFRRRMASKWARLKPLLTKKSLREAIPDV